MPGDYLFHQRQRRNNNPAWAWDFRNKQPELYGGQVPTTSETSLLPERAPGRNNRHVAWLWDFLNKQPELYASQTPIEPQARLLPNRAPGARRAAASAYWYTQRRFAQAGGGPNGDPDNDSLQAGRYLLPDRAPGAKANRQAYQLRPFTIEGFAEDQELLHERRRIPERTARTLRASPAAYRLDAFQVDLFDAEDDLLRTRSSITERAPGYRRASADAYGLPGFEVDLYAGSDNPQTKPPGQSLLPDRQIVEDRAQYPERRQRRKVLPGRSEAPSLFPDSDELLATRALLPVMAPGARRADRTSYTLQTNPVDLYAPAAPLEFEELLGSRHLLPSRAPGAPRAARDAYGLVNNQTDLFAPPLTPESNELMVGRQMLPDRVAPARRRFRRKIYPGSPAAAQIAEGALFPLFPDKAHGPRRAANEAYQIDSFPVELYAALAPAEIMGRLLPERGYGRARAASEAYQIAPSLVELYAGVLPEEISHILLPARAPGRPRAANRAYELRNSEPAFLGAFVAPSVKPTRMLLGVGL